MRVTARCKNNPSCNHGFTLTPVQCQPYGCPALGNIVIKPADSCYPPGSQVELQVTTTDPLSCIQQYIWVFQKAGGQCTGVQNPPCPGGVANAPVYKFTQAPSLVLALDSANGFTEGNWTVSVGAQVNVSGGCANCPQSIASQNTLTFSIMQAGTCPTITSIDVNSLGTSQSGFQYQFIAHLAGNTAEAKISWDYGDGTSTPGTCVCGNSTSETTHTYAKADCGKQRIVVAVLDPGNDCCGNADKSVSLLLPECNGTGTGNGNGGCPFWNPFCKGWNFCSALLAAALVAVFAAGILVMVGACTTPPNPYVLIAAGVAAAVSFILLGIWYAVCGRLPGFCDSLKGVLDLLEYVIYIQTIILAVAAVLALLGIVIQWPCVLGALASWAYYQTVFHWLLQLNTWAGCPPYVPPHLHLLARGRKHKHR